ncbi:1505_t:CDS:2, partial [Funneliformis geosporum]
HSFAFLLYARGDLLYQCVASVPQWVMVNVDSYFINEINKDQHFDPAFEVVHHYITNPPVNGGKYTWEALLKNDTTKVTAKSENTSSQGDANLPWELYAATQRDEGGRFSTISYIIRLNTNGGVAPPKGECGVQYTDKSTKSSTYEAEYWFYEGPLPGSEKKNEPKQPASDGYSIKSLHNQTPLSIGPGQLGWIAIVGFVSV